LSLQQRRSSSFWSWPRATRRFHRSPLARRRARTLRRLYCRPKPGIAERVGATTMNRRATILVGGALGLIAAGLGIYFWHGPKPPNPPELALDDTDPEFRTAVENARSAILSAPKSASAWATYGMVLRAGVHREPAAECFAEAALLDPRDPRWPY